ncbi:MAG: hypothetical protein KDC98_18325 [Planctomycetes bacterium]|nr:hypothetical protein [Planctomycetota bacterium]
MTDLVTVRVANTPIQAKMFVALLQAEGIPAHIDGATLVDEFAISQRLLNATGTAIKVRRQDLELAQELLTAAAEGVDEAELEAQAMAAANESDTRARAAQAADAAAVGARSGPMPHWPFVLLGLLFGGIASWMVRDVIDATSQNPFFDYAATPDGMRETWRRDPLHYALYSDRNGDHSYERIEWHSPSGTVMTALDGDGDGRHEQSRFRDASGTEATWREADGADFQNEIVVTNGAGKVVQQLRWVEGRGYENFSR